MLSQLLVLIAAGLHLTSAIPLNVNSESSIHAATATVARGIFSYYDHRSVKPGTKKWEIGLFPFPPYYWYESGAVWGGMIDYWAYTGDTTYVKYTHKALAIQAGPKHNYINPHQRDSEGNDDQEWWGYAVLAALEQGFPALPCAASGRCPPSYLRLATNVFDKLVDRWHKDKKYCNGGLRWQYNASHNGYNYKNAVTNSGFFNVAARLARFTGEQKYADWANKIWNWETSVRLIDSSYRVFDGTNVDTGCTDIDPHQWSYNAGIPLYGAAMMFNYTGGSALWKTRVQGLLDSAEKYFFTPFNNATGVMYEYQCEKYGSCNTDQYGFKAYLARYMGKTAQVAPFSRARIHSLLKSTAKGAARSCSGGKHHTTCGTKWYTGHFDGSKGLGQELSALEAIQALLA